MKVCLIIFIFITTLSSFSIYANEPYGYSNNSGLQLSGTAKYVIRPQKAVTNPTTTNTQYYQNTAGDRMYGHRTQNNYYHMGVDIWESPHMSNLNYTNPSDYIMLPMPGMLIAKTDNHNVYGNGLLFLHPQAGRNNEDIYSLFLHNEDSEIHNDLIVGSFYGARRLSNGINRLGYVRVIGKIGDTGSANGIPHLHYELRYFPEWTQQGFNNLYSHGITDFNRRNQSHENPHTFSLNAISMTDYSDEFRINIALNAYYERIGKSPQNESECLSLFIKATSDNHRYRSLSKNNQSDDYNYRYNNLTGECIYQKVSSNYLQFTVWKRNSRSKLVVEENSSARFNSNILQNEVDMLNFEEYLNLFNRLN